MNRPAPSPGWTPRADWLRSDPTPAAGPGLPEIMAVTVLGALLRVWQVTGQSLWVDEMLTWQALRPGGPFGFLEQFLDTIQGPVYLAAAWPLVHAADTELSLRLPALLAGILAVPLFGILAGRWLPGRGARLALLLFALNPFHVWYSQEGRGYAFLVLGAILVALAYRALALHGPSRGRVLAFALAGTFLVLSNLSGVFLLLAMGLTVLLVDRPTSPRQWWGWGVAFGLVVLLTAPWLLKASGIWALDRVVPGAATGASLRGESTFSPLAVPYTVFTFLFGYSLGPSLRELHQPDRMAVLAGYWPVLAAAGASGGIALLAGLFGRERRRIGLLIWILVPVGFLLLLAVRNVKPWNPRYVAVALPWIVLLAGAGLARLPRRPGFVAALALVGLTLWSLGGYFGADRYAKADVRGAVAHVAAARPATGTVLVPVVTDVYAWYDRDAHQLLNSYGRPQLVTAADADAFVADVLAGHDRCRVVLARLWFLDPEGLLVPALARVGELDLEAERPGVEIYTWQRYAPGRGS